MELRRQKNLCTVLTSLCKYNFNLPMFSSSFSALCLVASSCWRLPGCTALIFLFFCFQGSWFCCPAINQASLSQSVCWVCIYKLYQYVAIWGELCPIFNFCGKHFWPIRKLTWLDKNIFYWIVETDLKDRFIMYYFLQLWGPDYENCQLLLSTGAINLWHWRTTYCLLTQTIML